MEATWNKVSKVGIPTNVEHVRHGDARKAVLFFPVFIISIYLLILLANVVLVLSAGGPESGVSALASEMDRGGWVTQGGFYFFAGLVALVILYELLYRLTHKRWLSSTISLGEAQEVARVREAADSLGFGEKLPPLPDNFPEMTNQELQAWCRSASTTLQSQHRLAIRHQAGLRDYQARPAT